MQKFKKFGHITSLSKTLSIPKQTKNLTSLPSPRNKFQKFSFSIRSPEKENEILLMRRKFLKKSKQAESTSNYLSFGSPRYQISVNKKQSLNGNLSIKSQLMLSSVDLSESNKDTISSYKKMPKIQKTKNIQNISVQKKQKKVLNHQITKGNSIKEIINTSISQGKKKSSYTAVNSRKNSKGKGSCKNLFSNNSCLYSKLLRNGIINKDKKKTNMNINIKYSQYNIKKMTSPTTASSPARSKYITLINSKKNKDHNENSKDKIIMKNKTTNNSKSKGKKNNENNIHKEKSNSKKHKKGKTNSISNLVTQSYYDHRINILFNDTKKQISKIKQNFIKRFSLKNSPSREISQNSIPFDINNYNNNILVPNPSLSTLSSYNKDSNYYLSQSNKISLYIKKYYTKNKEYPKTLLDFYKYGRLIGQGAFGKVNLGLNVLTGRVVAIKSFNKEKLKNNKESIKKIIEETNLMKQLNHPSITKILELFESEKYILLIMEYINGGNLYSFVKKRRKLTEKTAKFLFKQIIQGIKYMHSKNIVHRDIKLENILIDLNNNIKICDFGIGKVLPPEKEKHILYEQCGTPMYIAPEIFLSSKEKGYDAFPVDVWSAGVSLYIMLSGTLPFKIDKHEGDNGNSELHLAIINKDPNPIDDISDEAKDLLKGLLEKNPKKRLNPTQVLNHPWLKDENRNGEKYHLFTKAEMIMLSKTYVDYRYAKPEDIKESFSINNLIADDKSHSNVLKSSETKSVILAPYNTMIYEERENLYEDLENLYIENENILFSNKVREYNMNYELNNNGELDNGILINSRFDIENGNVTTESFIYIDDETNDNYLGKVLNVRTQGLLISREEKDEDIFKKMGELGYNKIYVQNCLKNNEFCHATAVYYLISNYAHID